MKHSFIFSSNSIRLSPINWVYVLIIIILIFYLLPVSWKVLERLEPSADYRLPYEFSNDYWVFARWSKRACLEYPVLMIGDSVVWGQYVSMEETLPHYLNKLENRNIFANMGVDGMHPAAMAGLIKYYGRAISNKGVILHLNPLWMSSERHDLRGTEEFRFNHSPLVPQFTSMIACYRASFSQRIGVAAERSVSFLGWASHIRASCFENMDIHNWTIQNPYKNPLKVINMEIPAPENKPHSNPITWSERGMEKQDFPWVNPEESFQWSYFKKVIKILKARDNKVFVIIGPFNPYILTEKSQIRYNNMKGEMAKWLNGEGISYTAIPDLPGEYYADASHPLREGYALIAQELLKMGSFNRWLDEVTNK